MTVLARAILTHVPPAMRLDGSFAGSFDPHGPSGRFGGRVASTALLLHAWSWAERCSKLPAVRAPAEPGRKPR